MAESLANSLQSQNFFLTTNQTSERLLTEASQYFWVQWRKTSNEPWRDVDPALKSDVIIARPPAIEYFSDSIPHEYQHQVRFRISLQQSIGDTRRNFIVAETENWPVASLVSSPITISFVPNGFRQAADFDDVASALDRSLLWLPMINNVPGQSAFDVYGNVVDSLVAGAPGAALFQTNSNKFATAIGALRGDSSSATPTIAHLWLDRIVTSPTDGEKSYRTDLLSPTLDQQADLVGYRLSEMQLKGRLTSTISTVVAVGRFPIDYWLDQMLGRLLAMTKFVIAEPATLTDQNNPFANDAYAAHVEFYMMVDDGIDQQGVLSYRSGPAIVDIGVSLTGPSTMQSVINIVSSPRRTFSAQSNLPVLDYRGNIFAGVWESTVEEELLKSGTGYKFSASAKLRGAARSEKEFGFVSQRFDGSEISGSIPFGSQEWMMEDLKKGFAVIFPENQDSVDGPWVWWRVDPATGETLAMAPGGYGVSMSEDLVLKIKLGSSLIASSAAFFGCAGVPGKDPAPSRAKQLGCAVCSMFAGATTYLAMGVIIQSSIKAIVALKTSSVKGWMVTVTPKQKLIQQAKDLAAILAGIVCGYTAASG